MAYRMEHPKYEPVSPAAAWAGMLKEPTAKVQTRGSFSLSPFAEPFDPRSTKPKLEPTRDKKTAIYIIYERSWRGEKLVILMWGVPGSGKSTLASQVKAKGVVLSTDDFFVNRFGRYVFNPVLLAEAHQWNQKRAENEIKRGTYPIIIDNTNLESWQMQPYICLAIKYNYGVVLMEPETPWRYDAGILSQKNRHRVSREKIRQMLEKLNVPFELEHLIEECRRTMPKSGSESRKPVFFCPPTVGSVLPAPSDVYHRTGK